jgi:hypothetical protein
MATWYYIENGEQRGPISDSELKTRAKDRLLKSEDQVWKEGMSGWVQASRVKGLFPAAPPPVPPVNGPPPVSSLNQEDVSLESPNQTLGSANQTIEKILDPKNRMIVGFRAGLILATFSVLLPWVQAFGETATGFSSLWGVLVALISVAGVIFSFMSPIKYVKQNCKKVMASIGGAVLLFALLGLIHPVYKGRSHELLDAGFGVYFALIGGGLASFCGIKTDWEKLA